MNEPVAKRLSSPGYGFEGTERPGEALPWARVEKLLTDARNYWLVTANRKGKPHAAPVWAIWDDNRLYFSTSRDSRKGRNLDANPRVVVHLDHDEAAVIVEGICERITHAEAVARFVRVYDEKYQWGDTGALLEDPGNAVYVVHPLLVFSFGEPLGETATRWEFPD